MTFAFDLISDLHVETWVSFDWTEQPTAPYCVVAGDVCRDREVLIRTLTHLGECYRGGVFYIDGNDEHRYSQDDLGASFRDLERDIAHIPNVVYLQNNVVIINGVAIIATNGWWSYDFDPTVDYEQSLQWYIDDSGNNHESARSIVGIAYHDAAYLANAVKRMQTHTDVRKIVVVTHTLPDPELIEHDIDLGGTWRYNCMGNSHMRVALEEDTEHKIHTWCFGHYHLSEDRVHHGVRYVSNPRGRGNTIWSQTAYFPKRIEVEI
jgi:hypothetical protein